MHRRRFWEFLDGDAMAARPKNLFWYRFCGGKQTVSRGGRCWLHSQSSSSQGREDGLGEASREREALLGRFETDTEHFPRGQSGTSEFRWGRQERNTHSPRGHAFPCSAGGLCLPQLPPACLVSEGQECLQNDLAV